MKLFFYLLCIHAVLAKNIYAVDATQFMTPLNQTNFNDAYTGQGREGKAKQAKEEANKGSAAAAAAGAAMMATGVPMSLSIILPVKLAGLELIAKAIKEFAQAGADKSAANDNGAQNDLLRRNNDPQASGINENARVSDYIPQEFRDQLQQQGIDPNDFLRRLENNEFQNGQDMLRAMGHDEISQSDIAKGLAMADQETIKALAAAHGTTGVDENRSQLAAVSPSSTNPQTAIVDHLGNKTIIAGAEKNIGKKTKDAGTPTTGSSGMNGLSRGLASNLLGQPQQVGDAQLSREQYLNIGVQSPSLKQNIFQVARRQYRSFSKWQKEELAE